MGPPPPLDDNAVPPAGCQWPVHTYGPFLMGSLFLTYLQCTDICGM